MQFNSIWPIDRTLSGATTPAKSGPGSNGNEGVLRIPQSSSISGTSPSDCFVSYSEQLWRGRAYPSAEVQSVYSTAPANWIKDSWWAIVRFYYWCSRFLYGTQNYSHKRLIMVLWFLKKQVFIVGVTSSVRSGFKFRIFLSLRLVCLSTSNDNSNRKS